MEIIQGDNLDTLRKLRKEGAKFDLVEFDGPYMAGLEKWDNLTEAEYLEHYATRLTLTRDILYPWGVVFLFGYPEGCAEVKAWAHKTKTFYLRRWLTWYKQKTIHKGRKVENILLFWKNSPSAAAAANWGRFLRAEREKRNWTLRKVGELANHPWWHRGGNLYYENGNGGFPSLDDIFTLSHIFDFSIEDWPGVFYENYDGLTNLDYINTLYLEETQGLNTDGLRSKPVQLYLDLFRPTIPPIEKHRALILYGGSGNAGIAAAALGYDVTVCEIDAVRCETIKGRWDREVARWEQYANSTQLSLPEAQQMAMEGI